MQFIKEDILHSGVEIIFRLWSLVGSCVVCITCTSPMHTFVKVSLCSQKWHPDTCAELGFLYRYLESSAQQYCFQLLTLPTVNKVLLLFCTEVKLLICTVPEAGNCQLLKLYTKTSFADHRKCREKEMMYTKKKLSCTGHSKKNFNS